MTVEIFKNRHDGDVSAATPGSNFVPSSFFYLFFFVFLFFFCESLRTCGPRRDLEGGGCLTRDNFVKDRGPSLCVLQVTN